MGIVSIRSTKMKMRGSTKRRGRPEQAPRANRSKGAEQGEQRVEAESPINAKQARKKVEELIWQQAGEIAQGIIDAAKSGQLTHTKYLFELGGIHPLLEDVCEKLQGESVIQSLLRRANEARDAARTNDQHAIDQTRDAIK